MDLVVHSQVGLHAFEPCILFSQFLEAFDIIGRATILDLLIIKRGFGNRVLPADIIKQVSISGMGCGQVQLNTAFLAAGTYNYSLFVDGRHKAAIYS
jgi:hypothetical protein